MNMICRTFEATIHVLFRVIWINSCFFLALSLHALAWAWVQQHLLDLHLDQLFIFIMIKNELWFSLVPEIIDLYWIPSNLTSLAIMRFLLSFSGAYKCFRMHFWEQWSRFFHFSLGTCRSFKVQTRQGWPQLIAHMQWACSKLKIDSWWNRVLS